MSISVAKWIFFFVSLCFENNFLLALDFPQLQCWNCLLLLPFLVYCFCRIRDFPRLRHRNKLVKQIVMGHRSKTFACNVVFMMFGLRRFHSLSCGLMRFHHTTIRRVWSVLGCNLRLCKHFRDAIWKSFTRHGRCHRFFQISSRIFQSLFVFFIIRIDEGKFLSFSEHYRVLVSLLPILAFLFTERLLQFGSILQATHSQVWSLLEFLSVSTRTTFVPWEVFLLIE